MRPVRLLSELQAVPPAGGTVPSLQPALRWRLAALAVELPSRADQSLSQELAEVLQAEAERTVPAPRSAALWVLRAALLTSSHPQATIDGGPVEDSLQRALTAEPGHGPALLRLHLRAASAPGDALAHSPLAHALVAALRARLRDQPEAARGHDVGAAARRRPGARVRRCRRGAFDLPRAARLCPRPPGAVRPRRDAVGDRLAGRPRRWRSSSTSSPHEADYDVRFALLLQAGEYLEAHHQPAQAAKHFAQALEIRPGHPVARSAQVRAYQAAGMLDELAKVTAAELKEATDIQTRVLAFERQALLANLRGGDPAVRHEAIMTSYRNILNIDANNHGAMRALERHHIAHEQWGDLIHLYEQMGLTAMDTAFGVHIHLDRARLRQRLVWQGQGDASAVANELENDFRLALYRDRHIRPALRYLLSAALRKDDLPQMATLYASAGELGTLAGDELAPENSEAQSQRCSSSAPPRPRPPRAARRPR